MCTTCRRWTVGVCYVMCPLQGHDNTHRAVQVCPGDSPCWCPHPHGMIDSVLHEKSQCFNLLPLQFPSWNKSQHWVPFLSSANLTVYLHSHFCQKKDPSFPLWWMTSTHGPGAEHVHHQGAHNLPAQLRYQQMIFKHQIFSYCVSADSSSDWENIKAQSQFIWNRT